MHLLLLLVIFLSFILSTLQKHIQDQASRFILDNKFRRLQSCSQYCETCDIDGTCLKCIDQRVFPDCNCQIGYYSDSQGNCQPCKQGCLACTSASTCSECQKTYTLDTITQDCNCNIPNTDGTCINPKNGVLFYYSRMLNDYQSLEVIFNQMIFIKAAANLQLQFIPSPNNCQILSASSLALYQDYGANCAIDSLRRNRLIINFQQKGTQFDVQKVFSVPEFDKSQIQIQINEQIISTSEIYKLEDQMRVQNNVVNRICFFSQNDQYYIYNQSPTFLMQPLINLFIYKDEIVKEVTVISPPQYVGEQFDVNFYATPTGVPAYQVSFKNTPQVEVTIILSIKCSIFGASTISQSKINLSSSKETNKNMYSALQLLGVFLFTVLPQQVNFQASGISNFQDYSIQFFTSPQVTSPFTKYLVQADATGSISFQLPQFTVKETKEVVFVVHVQDLNGEIVCQSYAFGLFLSLQYVTELNQPIPKQNPFSDVWITVNTKDFYLGQSQILSSDYYVQSWSCFDQNKNACVSRTGQPFQLQQLGNRMMLPADQMQVNMQYTFYYQFKSIGFEFSKQYQQYVVDTGSTFAIANFKYLPQKTTINMQDIVYIVLLIGADFPYQIGQALFNLEITIGSETKSIQSVSNQISFIPQDYIPNPDLSTPALKIKYSIYDYYFQQTIPMQNVNQPLQIDINPPLTMQISIPTQTYIGYQDQVTITCVGCNADKYQFFYYTNQSDRDYELKFPLYPKRKMLSLEQQTSEIKTILPPGDLVIMILGYSITNNQFTNITQTLTITGSTLTQQAYTNLVQDQYNQAQLYQSQNRNLDQILTYQTIMEAIEQYENSNTSPSAVNDLKLNILNNLLQNQWQSQVNNILTLSGQIIYRLLLSQINLNKQTFSLATTQVRSRISFIYSQVRILDAASLNADVILLYSENIKISTQIYMELVNKSVNFGKYPNADIVSTTVTLMSSYSFLLQTNQSPISLSTAAASLLIEKYDDITFLYNYYQLVGQNLDSINFSQNYYVLTQRWSNTTYLYRDELQQINSQYIAQANSSVLPLLQRTYDIKIPSVFTDQPYDVSPSRRRRFLQTTPPDSLRPNFILSFGQVSQEEILQCVQRQATGKWVHNSCQTKVEVINNKRQLSCICKTPDATSIIADITSLIENKNLQKIFSADGILGLADLTNWYEYAAIWTIIGLNVGFVVLMINAVALDKLDSKIMQSLSSSLNNVDSTPDEKPVKTQKMLLMIKQNKLQSKLSENLLEDDKKSSSIKIKKQNSDEGKQTETQNDHELQLLSKKQNDKKDDIFENQKQNDQNNKTQQNENKILNKLENEKESSLKLKRSNSGSEEEGQNKQETLKSKQLTLSNNDNKQSFLNMVTTTKNLTIEQLNENQPVSNEQLSPKNKELHIIPSKKNLLQQDSIKSKKNKIVPESQIGNESSALNEKQLKLQIEKEKNLKKKQEKEEKEKEEKMKDEQAKEKLKQYLDKEKPILGIISFHQFLSLFFVYFEGQSRLIRSAIYYNKLIWLLTLNSIFGKNLSVVQVIVLSIVTTIVLTIVTTIIQILLSKKQLVKVGLVVIFLFCLFCYYSILVVIAGEDSGDANMWIISYFATFILNEFIVGILVSVGMYYGCKKLVQSASSNTILELLGAGLLLQTFRS